MEIRHMEQTDDRFAISHIYEESWKFAYKDIIPQSYLESIPVGRWISNFEDRERNTLIMIENSTFIGTSSYGASRYADLDNFGEIISIYFLPEYMGKEYGKQMLYATMEELKHLGYQDVFLWVLEDNHRARRFYEKAGLVLSNDYIETTIGGKKLREIQYRFHIK